jgi:4-aminobutyrate aminotransferase
MDRNEEILAQEALNMPKASRVKYFDLVLDHGKGALLYDVDGREYIDLLASASSANTGHSHPRVVAAIQEQAEKLIHFTPAYYANASTSSLLKRLAELTPGDFPKKVALGNSGSDANEAVIKFSRAYTGRPYIVSFTGAYHGSTYGALSLSAVSLNMSRKIGPLLPAVVHLPFPDRHKLLPGETEEDFVDRMWAELTEAFENWLPADEVACVLIEPIQGDGGIIAAPKAYVQRLYRFCRDNGILFAVDEINQGLGRTGKLWSIDHFDVIPDLMTVGKSIASGMPLSALIGRSEVMDSLSAPAHVFTTAGNPVSAAAAHATLDVMADEKLVERSARLGQRAAQFFKEEKNHFSFIGDARIYGLNGGIDIVSADDGKPDVAATTKLIYRLYQLGLIMISLRGNILRFQPPLVISDAQLQTAFDRLHQAFTELAAGRLELPDKAEKIGW